MRQSGHPSGGGGAKQPFSTASVGEGSGKPSGYMWDMLDKAKTPAEVRKVREFAKQHGYSPDGQLMQAIADRLSEG
jgi:hypothetical protein